ncbi:ejaculatory bulb-specific protein 3-like isoform X2 [Thrips palmi]|nr:ejaculatory bulb-specific protein 3-like isoform X2 [Thrips palmi]XP_034246541.1 ejaculatory bulb-specific protein 3-like isoform X2 [Thrips palmi]
MDRTVRTCLLAGLALLSLAYVAEAETYDEGRFAHINVDEVLGNQRILVAFIKCFLDQGPCTADSKDMKKLLPDVLDTRCAKCTDRQKKMMAQAVKHVKEHYPKEWEELVNKYDPDHSKSADLDDFLIKASA